MKGVTPLIAAVFLIAVTMTVAGLLSYWASSFVKEQTATIDKQSVGNECNFANFEVNACSYKNSKATFILDNVGSVDLKNITVFALYSDNTLVESKTGQDLASASLRSFTANSIRSGFTTLRIRGHCPAIFEETKCG